MSKLFYKPEDGWLADVIPFYEDGEFKLLYLKDWRDREGHGEGTPWFLLGTWDFIHYKEYGEVLPRGGVSEQDLYIYTGCVLKKDGLYHIFYTGNNFHYPAEGKAQQAVMHAVSSDFVHWEKRPQDAFYAPTEVYEEHDWRDPFVFWNEEAGEYWMLLAARLKEGPAGRRGCVALCASKDLTGWEVRDPFWAPYLYTTHECPDLFRMGEWWYLLYSTFSDRTVTHYRMSRSLQGPWLAPENDALDTRAFYAAKTWTDGERRYAFGWNPTREGEHDGGTWQWGGHLVVHEVVQGTDGALLVKVPDTLNAAFNKESALSFTEVLGRWKFSGSTAAVTATDSFAGAYAGPLPDGACKLEATITFAPGTRGCGIVLRTDQEFRQGYMIRLEPGRNRIVVDQWPRKGDVPYAVGMERPLQLLPGSACSLSIYLEDQVCVVYVNEELALSTRLYDFQQGGTGLFVSEGSAEFIFRQFAM